MMPDLDKESLVFPNLCFYLFESDPERRSYLEQILAFVEGEIKSLESPDDFSRLHAEASNDCGAVLIGSGKDRDQQIQLLEAIKQEVPSMPAFVLYGESDGKQLPTIDPTACQSAPNPLPSRWHIS